MRSDQRRFGAQVFEQAVAADIQTILLQKEPAFLAGWLGSETGPADPLHKIPRLCVLVFSLGLPARLLLATALVAASCLVPVLNAPYGFVARAVLMILTAAAGLVGIHLWISKRGARRVQAARVFWRKYGGRSDLSLLELSRLCHVFNACSMGNVACIVLGQLLMLGIVTSVFSSSGWLPALVAAAILYVLHKLTPIVGMLLLTALFAKPLPPDIAELSTYWEEAGLVPGDRSRRSLTMRNPQTGRALRLPSTRGSTALAFVGQVSAVVATMLVFVPITWVTMNTWVTYTPVAALSTAVAIWLLAKVVRLAKASDRRQFRSVLLRPFRNKTSSVARHAVTPVMGSVGRGTTVEDDNFSGTHLVSNPNFIGLDVVTGDDCVVPFVTRGDWHADVEEMIANADAAVIDVTEFNDNLRWEVEVALRHLPPERLVFVAHGGDFAPLRNHLASASRGHVLETAATIAYRPSYLYRLAFRWRLLQVFKDMRDKSG